VTAEPLARVEAPAMRPLDPSTDTLPLPPTAGARAPSGGPAAATATLAVPPSVVEGSLATPSTAAVAGRPGPDGPARLDFGPRRTVDPDLAALVGEPVPATPASPAEGRIDLETTRALARELNRAPRWPRTGQPVDLASPKPDGESTLGRAIARAAQPDCRAAYAGLGLLGLPFLLFDNLTDTGCRW
jgi:hypothetical protein